jgi:methionine aminopeptidase
LIVEWIEKNKKLSALPELLRNIRQQPKSPMVSTSFYLEALAKVIKKISVGSKIFDLCLFGDSTLLEDLSKVYNKKPVFKGIAFPTCISVNEICGHFSPLEDESITIKEGDLVKIELGAHVDGFAAFAAHTIVVQSDAKAAVTGPKADVILAAYKSLQAALRLIKPGNFNNQVT